MPFVAPGVQRTIVSFRLVAAKLAIFQPLHTPVRDGCRRLRQRHADKQIIPARGASRPRLSLGVLPLARLMLIQPERYEVMLHAPAERAAPARCCRLADHRRRKLVNFGGAR